MLAHQLPSPLPPHDFWDTLECRLAWLAGEVSLQLPRASNEGGPRSRWFPQSDHFLASGFPMELIRYAGATASRGHDYRPKMAARARVA